METKIIVEIANQKIPATLNNTKTAQEFAKILPFQCRATHYEFDFCASVEESLPTESSEQTKGWKNGDIGYGGGWFSVLVDGEQQSGGYDMMIVGHMDEGYLEIARQIPGSVEIKVSLV